VYNQSIDRDTYQTQLTRLREDQLLIEMELNETRVEELDVESAVNFALFTISDASRFWIEASLEQKQRFQHCLFPDGLAFDGKEFGTARTCFSFQLFTANFATRFAFGVPKHSDLEPDY